MSNQDAWSDIEADVLARLRANKSSRYGSIGCARASARAHGRGAAPPARAPTRAGELGGRRAARAHGRQVDELIVLGDGVAHEFVGEAQPTHPQRPQPEGWQQSVALLRCTGIGGAPRGSGIRTLDSEPPSPLTPQSPVAGHPPASHAATCGALGAGDVLGLDELFHGCGSPDRAAGCLVAGVRFDGSALGAASGRRRCCDWAAKARAWTGTFARGSGSRVSIVAQTDVKGWRLSHAALASSLARRAPTSSAPGTSWHTFARSRHFRTCLRRRSWSPRSSCATSASCPASPFSAWATGRSLLRHRGGRGGGAHPAKEGGRAETGNRGESAAWPRRKTATPAAADRVICDG